MSVETSSASPPPEILAAIASAAAAFDDLAAEGLHVSFDSAAGSAGLDMSLQDRTGRVLSALTPSQVLALADGNAPDQTRSTSNDVNDQHGRDD